MKSLIMMKIKYIDILFNNHELSEVIICWVPDGSVDSLLSGSADQLDQKYGIYQNALGNLLR